VQPSARLSSKSWRFARKHALALGSVLCEAKQSESDELLLRRNRHQRLAEPRCTPREGLRYVVTARYAGSD
jgi:hypothetical protein